jgi:hypothetical protein
MAKPSALATAAKALTPVDAVVLVPPSFEAFRMEAGRAAYVDFKSHPYRADEVLEWRRRMGVAERLYGEAGVTPRCTALQTLVEEGAVTHAVLPHSTKRSWGCARHRLLYRNSEYGLYALARL